MSIGITLKPNELEQGGYESVESFLARGGKIKVIPPNASSEWDGLTETQRKTKERYHKNAGKAGQAALQQKRMTLGETDVE